jgi:hypothetical protein
LGKKNKPEDSLGLKIRDIEGGKEKEKPVECVIELM